MYLKDLIETNHVFMKLLEHLGKKQRNLIVLCKPKKKTSKSTIIFIIYNFLFLYYVYFIPESKTPKVTSEDNDTMWANFNLDLKEIIQMPEFNVDVVEAKPYDPVSDVSMEDQK